MCSILILLPLAASAQSKRIAVYDFDYKAVKGDVVQIFGSDKDVGAQAASRLISKLIGKGNFEVIDRNQIDRILKEQNQKFSDRFDPRDAPKLGRLLNVDAIVTGTVDTISGEVQNHRVGVGPVGVGQVQAVAEVTMSVRVISTQTGQIFMAEQVNNKQTHNLGKGGKVGNSAGGDGGTVNPHPVAMAATPAIQGAADEIAAKLIDKADTLPSRTGGSTTASKTPPDVPAGGQVQTAITTPSTSNSPMITVGKVDGAKVYLTGGENMGVKPGEYYEVRRVTGTMKDPQGNDIEMDERVETIVVTDVQDRFSVAKPTSGTSVAKVGDRLKKAKAPAVSAPKKNAAAPAALPPPVQRKQ